MSSRDNLLAIHNFERLAHSPLANSDTCGVNQTTCKIQNTHTSQIACINSFLAMPSKGKSDQGTMQVWLQVCLHLPDCKGIIQ
jgi:hypothetical protein